MKKILIFVFVGLMFSSCADESLAPIITFDQAAKGAYIKLVEEGPKDIDLFDIPGSVYTYSVEFVDLEDGNLVAEYNLDLTVKDNSPDNDNISAGPIRFRSIPASEFGTTDNGLKGVANISISALDMLASIGKTAEQLGSGDQFKMAGSIVLQDGSVFGASNSSPAVRGTAFGGHFDFNMNAVCPTSLDGTYEVTTSASWCGNTTAFSKLITITGSITGYDISDFALGAYELCYGDGTDTYDPAGFPLGNLKMVDVCTIISITGASQWGEIYTWHSIVIDGDDFIIEWSNDYGEGGTSAINRPGGWPDLHL